MWRAAGWSRTTFPAWKLKLTELIRICGLSLRRRWWTACAESLLTENTHQPLFKTFLCKSARRHSHRGRQSRLPACRPESTRGSSADTESQLCCTGGKTCPVVVHHPLIRRQSSVQNETRLQRHWCSSEDEANWALVGFYWSFSSLLN